MDAGQLSLTRRALLAGACAAPVAAAVPASDGRKRVEERWRRAVARYASADAALLAAAGTGDEDLYDRLGDRYDAALTRLLRSPVPDMAALVVKLDLLVEQQAWELTDGDLCLAALREDAHRLAAVA
jgi:hypothetical protein